jgi:hypothetical protein
VTSRQAMIFWLSGVFTSSFHDVLFKAFSKNNDQAKYISALIGFQELHDRLSLGLISDLEYCQTIYKEAHLLIKPETIINQILAFGIKSESIFEILNLLPKNYQFWLIVDYPESWIEKIIGNISFQNFFPIERRIPLSKFGLKNISPDLFEFLPRHIHLPIDRCLLIDNNSKRAIRAINFGLPSLIYVDPRRLTREFKLRKLIND